MVTALSAKYIKLGPKGSWEQRCFKRGILQLGFDEVPHKFGLTGDVDAIRAMYIDMGRKRQVATNYANQVCHFYKAPKDTVWITFSNGYLWWCLADEEVVMRSEETDFSIKGSRYRKTINGWSNKNKFGNLLHDTGLSGNLTKVSSYQSVICNVDAFEYLIRKINGEDLPEIVRAKKIKDEMLWEIRGLLKLLTWQDFELLVELIFAQSGWQRIGATGGVQKTVDIELMLPTTKERAFVQVKSKTNQAQLNEYVERLSNREEAHMFYVYHSGKEDLKTDNPRVIVVGPERLSEMVLEAGLLDWLMAKVS